jgi:hypothetical protein
MMNAYMARLMYGALYDARITEAFMRVAGLMDPPQALMRPSMVLRVLRQSRRRPEAAPEQAADRVRERR